MLSRKFALANLHGNETNLVIDKLGVAVADGACHDISSLGIKVLPPLW